MEEKTIKSARNIASRLVLKAAAYLVALVFVIRWVIPSLIDLHDDAASWLAVAVGILTAVAGIWIVADFGLTINKLSNKD